MTKLGSTLGVSNEYPSLAVSGRLLNDRAGSPVFFQGEAAWSLFVELSPAQVDTYLSNRALRGYNALLVNLIDNKFGTNAPNNYNDDAPFTTPGDFTTPNEAYFSHADYIIKKAASLGFYLIMSATYLGSGDVEGWGAEIDAASAGDLQTWGEYCGSRYRHFDNIMWVVGGDRAPSAARMTKLNAWVTGLKNYDTLHLVTHHDQVNIPASYVIDTYSVTWLDVNNTYATYPNEPGDAQDAYARDPVLPFFMIEGWYENEHDMTSPGLRSQAYWTVLNGANGHIFGNCPIWNFSTAPTYCSGAWADFLASEGSYSMTHFGNLFRSIAWSTLVPDTAHGLLTTGYSTGADYAAAAIDSGGTLAVIYMPNNRTMTVDMTNFAGNVTARWYDPTDGSYTDDAASPVANTGTHDFSRATSNNDGDGDWVLVMTT